MPVTRSSAARTRTAALVAGALTLAACVLPPKPLVVRPSELPATPPAVSVWSPSALSGGLALSALYFSTDRDAYATAFEVDRNGRVRVVYPASPRDNGRVRAGRTYAAVGQGLSTDRAFLTPGTDWRRVPFLFVVVSDARPDLREFGTGRSWTRQVRTDAIDAEEVVDAVAARVATGVPSTPGGYSADYAYLGPRLTAREILVAAQCAAPVDDPKNYWYFRELWAVFTPADPTLGLTPMWTFGSTVTWASAPYLGMSLDRMQWARTAFRGPCASPFGQPAYRNPFILASRQRTVPGGTTVAVGNGTTPAGAQATRPLPPAGAAPTPLRVPRTPRDVAEERLAGDATGEAGRLGEPGTLAERAELQRVRPSDRLRRTVETAETRRVAFEPLDRAEVLERAVRGQTGWTSTDGPDGSERVRSGGRAPEPRARKPEVREPRLPAPASERPAMGEGGAGGRGPVERPRIEKGGESPREPQL